MATWRSNCLFWALGEVRRKLAEFRRLPEPERSERSIGIGFRWSEFWWGGHVFTIHDPPDEICKGFTPVEPKRRRRWWNIPVVFRGQVTRGKR